MGSSERFYFTVITVLCFGATILLQNLVSSRDLHQEVACYRDRLRINCGDHSFIAIHEAFFTTRVQDNATCGPSAIEHEHHLHYDEDEEEEDEEQSSPTDPTKASPECQEDIRVSINRKCSGSMSCDYSYHEQSNKQCPNMRGQFVVRYDCVRNNSLVKFCNTKLVKPEGYFSSPGFPQFYPKLSQCGWTISAQPGQTILLKVLHLHLRPPSEIAPTPSDPDSLYALGILAQMVSEEDVRCELDSLTILERGGSVKRASVCGESASALKAVEVDSGEAEISFKSNGFEPASGFLMYYKTLDEVATTTVMAPLSGEGTEAAAAAQMENNSTSPNADGLTTAVAKAAYLEDIIIPSVLIGVLLIVNAIIVATILIIKRRNKAKMAEEDENFEDPKSEPLVPEIKDV